MIQPWFCWRCYVERSNAIYISVCVFGSGVRKRYFKRGQISYRIAFAFGSISESGPDCGSGPDHSLYLGSVFSGNTILEGDAMLLNCFLIRRHYHEGPRPLALFRAYVLSPLEAEFWDA